jgi:hypothetical protein
MPFANLAAAPGVLDLLVFFRDSLDDPSMVLLKFWLILTVPRSRVFN